MKPALAAEEWTMPLAKFLFDEFGYAGVGMNRMGQRWLCIDGTLWDQERLLPVAARLLDAALPDGDPHKLTWDDVDHLRAYAASTVCHGMGDYGPPDQYGPWISALADKIAALLPPREAA